MAKKIVIVFLLLGVVAVIVYAKYLAPSGNIDKYNRYIVPATDQVPAGGAIKVTFLGTTMLLFDDGETQLMIDGFVSRPPAWRVALRCPLKTDTALVDTALSRVKVERLKALFAAHSHYDHVLDAAYIVQKTHSHLYGSDSALQVGRGGGLNEDQMTVYEPGKEVPVGRFTVIVLKSRHSPPTCFNDDLGKTIPGPLQQPANRVAYAEGGSFDILIKHGDHAILVKPSANSIEGALDNVRAEILFLGTAGLGKQDPAFQNSFYDQTVAKVGPRRVIPIHWDDFFKPLSEHLTAPPKIVDNLAGGFDFLIGRLSSAQPPVQFEILQGYQSMILFDQAAPAPGP
jgi:L-ascorbate metabolism protein UlaG (beta-lactamase superfamily)